MVNITVNNCIILASVRQIKRCIPLVSHLLSDKTALDVALETLGLTCRGVNESMSLMADNVSGINSLAVFCYWPTGNLTVMCAHKFPFYWTQLASQRWEMF